MCRTFSLRALLVVVTFVCVALGYYNATIREEARLAAWVQSVGGAVLYNYHRIGGPDGGDFDPDAPAPPRSLYETLVGSTSRRIAYVNLAGKNVRDRDLGRLRAARCLTCLVLDGTQITDCGILELASIKRLSTLSLARTRVSDCGCVYISRLSQIHGLILARTKVTDDGLERLGSLVSLRYLDVDDTSVTGGGVKRLRNCVPGLRISFGGLLQ